jgi:hypothetical protein
MPNTGPTDSPRYDELTDREASPSGGYEYVFYILDCERPNCDRTGVGRSTPDATTYVCGNHTLDEFEREAEVKIRG